MYDKLIVWMHYGLDSIAYVSAKLRIRKYNLKRLRMFSAIIGLIFLALFFISYFTSDSSSVMNLRVSARKFYLLVGICAVMINNLSLNLIKRFKTLTIPFWYILLIILFSFAIWLSIKIQPMYPAVIFCAFIVVLPSLFIDRSYRIIPFMIIVTYIFLHLSYITKQHTIFLYDLGNVIINFIIGIFIAINNRRIQIRAITNELLLERQRDIDPLSTVNNRKAFERIVTNLSENSKGTLIILDIDNFKSFNDDYGHIYGDAVIRKVGTNIKDIFAENAIVGRFGGDEFLIYLMNNIDIKEIEELFEKLNESIGKSDNPNDKKIKLSAGAALYPLEGRKYSEIFALADERLLEVKHHFKGNINFTSND